MSRISINSRSSDALQVAGYLDLLSRDHLRALCKARKLTPRGSHKGHLVDVLAADLTRTGATLALTVTVKPAK